MSTESRIARFTAPTLDDLKDLQADAETLEKIRAVLCDEIAPRDASKRCAAWLDGCQGRARETGHEAKIIACDEILGTCGVEYLTSDAGDTFTDGGIGMCPPFSYCNAGDTYAVTLLRDHDARAWLVGSWGDVLAEYEEENELGEWEVFEECPDACPSCNRKEFTLEFFPGSARGPSFSWICDSCNHHCFAQSAEDAVPIDADACIRARKPNGMPWCFSVIVDDTPQTLRTSHGGKTATVFATAEDARRAYLDADANRVEDEDEDGSSDDGGDIPGTGDEESDGTP